MVEWEDKWVEELAEVLKEEVWVCQEQEEAEEEQQDQEQWQVEEAEEEQVALEAEYNKGG